jgi:hypothetical protein
MGVNDNPKPVAVSLHLRVAPALKRQVEEYARELGITTNAAAAVLLSEALRARKAGQ